MTLNDLRQLMSSEMFFSRHDSAPDRRVEGRTEVPRDANGYLPRRDQEREIEVGESGERIAERRGHYRREEDAFKSDFVEKAKHQPLTIATVMKLLIGVIVLNQGLNIVRDAYVSAERFNEHDSRFKSAVVDIAGLRRGVDSLNMRLDVWNRQYHFALWQTCESMRQERRVSLPAYCESPAVTQFQATRTGR